jgi:large subunit ribosomal protein L3
MTAEFQRTGLIATKVGMSQIFDESGNAVAVTLLKADSNVVIGVKNDGKDGYNAVVMGYGKRKASRVAKPQRGMCAKASVEPVAHVKEFRVSEDCLLNAGDRLDIEHFMVKQKIDITGHNTGKGFAGGMKRHNFRGLEASHGVSVTHRSHGSTGNRQDPGRTFPGKKMAGHLGTEQTTIQNLSVVHIDQELGLIAVNGSVPGKNGSYVYLTDSIKVVAPSELMYPAALIAKNASEESQPALPQAAAEEVQTATEQQG